MFRFRSLCCFLPIASALLAAPATVGAQDINAVIAGLREDIRRLDERTGSLRVEIEQLQRENAALRQQLSNSSSSVSLAQLNNAIADLEKTMRAGDQQVAARLVEKLEELAKRTNASLDALEKNSAVKPAGPAFVFSPDFPKTGVTYTVQPGDTLASIAQKHKADVRDIQNANKIAEPKTLQAGQTIFVPQR